MATTKTKKTADSAKRTSEGGSSKGSGRTSATLESKAKAQSPAKSDSSAKSERPAKAGKSEPPVIAKDPPTGAPVAVKPPKPPPGKPGMPLPPMPGRAPARAPERAEELKAKIGALASATNQIKALKRSLQRSFFEIGTLLGEIQTKRLYEAKGYGSFESFVEREVDLGKQLSLKLVRITQVFVKDSALSLGLDRLTAALAALDGEAPAQSSSSSSTSAGGQRSPIPPHKQ